MTDLIFNKDTDRYIYTGSRLRAGTTNNRLRLSSAYNESIIDLCNNGVVDISASSVFINGLKVVTTSSGDATSLTALQLAQNLDVSGLITSDGGIQIGSGSYGGKIYKSANPNELVIDPFTIDASNNISDASGQVTIMGDLVVRGNTTTISSTNVDISDVLLTLASGGATGNVNGAGIQLGNDGYASMTWNSTTQKWNFNKGVDISGGSLTVGSNFGITVGTGIEIKYNMVRPLTNLARIATTLSSFKIKYGPDLGSDISTEFSNVWRDASGWDLTYGVYPMSLYSRLKIEARITYTSSPEADQTISFKIIRESGASWYDVCSDISLGTNMGVTFNGVHTMMFYHDLSTISAGGPLRYKLQFMRNCPSNDTISTPFGIQASSSNLMSLQEIVSPELIV